MGRDERLESEETALRRGEERLRLALDAGRMGTWDWDVRTGMVTWSANLEALHGLAPGTFAGTFDAVLALVHPEDREAVRQRITHALESGGDYDIEYRFLRPDGTVHWTAGKGRVIADEAGQPVRMVGVCMDVSERRLIEVEREALLKFAERARREAEAAQGRTAFLAEAGTVLASSLDPEATLGAIAAFVVPRLADWCVVDLYDDGVARRVAAVHADPTRTAQMQALQHFPPDMTRAAGVPKVLRTGEPDFVAEVSPELLDASTRGEAHRDIVRGLECTSGLCVALKARGRILGAISMLYGHSGRRYERADLELAEELAHRAALAIDNAQLYVQAEDARRQAEAASRAKDEFLAMLGHELRNPLAAVQNAVRAAQQPDGPRIRALEIARRQTEQLGRLVDDLLDVSRITQGRIQLRKEPLVLQRAVERAVEATRAFIDERGHGLELSLPAQPVRLQADVARLEQIVTNLLHNAAKYTDPGGQIALVAEMHGPDVVLRVRDTGIGIAPEMLPRIFDLFMQGERGLDRADGGLGIGLTVVRRLVELHGGRVEARSAGAGHGSEFVVWLPALGATDAPGELPAPPGASSAAPARVLLVEDNPDAAESLAMCLQLLGNEVQVVHDGRAAIEAVRATKPELVLLDIGLPGMNGYEVARRLRLETGAERPVLVALTGYGREEDRQRAREAGFDHHLVKPVTAEVIERLVATLGARPRE